MKEWAKILARDLVLALTESGFSASVSKNYFGILVNISFSGPNAPILGETELPSVHIESDDSGKKGSFSVDFGRTTLRQKTVKGVVRCLKRLRNEEIETQGGTLEKFPQQLTVLETIAPSLKSFIASVAPLFVTLHFPAPSWAAAETAVARLFPDEETRPAVNSDPWVSEGWKLFVHDEKERVLSKKTIIEILLFDEGGNGPVLKGMFPIHEGGKIISAFMAQDFPKTVSEWFET